MKYDQELTGGKIPSIKDRNVLENKKRLYFATNNRRWGVRPWRA